ncbi:Kinesin-like protein KIF1B [Yarrowia sp. B02]|nr:Kinesin-like protein KIF1B [Yarrowia sp. B02]
MQKRSRSPANAERRTRPRPTSALASTLASSRHSKNPPLRTTSSSGNLSRNVLQTPSGNVKVVVRVRPFVKREQEASAENLIVMDKTSTTIKPPSGAATNPRNPTEPKTFTFDRSFDSHDPGAPQFAAQNTVYDEIGAEMLQHNFEGYNSCIFAYGQTGSGKSYTMMGTPEDLGLIPRTCEQLFSQIDEMASADVSVTVRVSYLEIYNERVQDLLRPAKKQGHGNNAGLRLREAKDTGPYVEGLSDFPVESYQDVKKYLELGNANRVTAATKMNDASSRSHAVFTLEVKQVVFDPEHDTTEEKTSRIRLVDLAGSERATATGNTGHMLREGGQINKSLTTLGRVISVLAESSGRNSNAVTPFRDSTLTWLLKENLGGNSKTVMVACISPTDYSETLSTLRYADQAKKIKTQAVKNQDILSAAQRDLQIEEMQERINELQSKVSEQSSRSDQSVQSTMEFQKIRNAVKLFQDRAKHEESKRKAQVLELEALRRHNKLLTGHINDMTVQTGSSEASGDVYAALKTEQDSIRKDLADLGQLVKDDVSKYEQLLA